MITIESNRWSHSFPVDDFDRIVLFQDEETLRAIVANNANMRIIAGADDDTKSKYPGAFIAGVLSADALENPSEIRFPGGEEIAKYILDALKDAAATTHGTAAIEDGSTQKTP